MTDGELVAAMVTMTQQDVNELSLDDAYRLRGLLTDALDGYRRVADLYVITRPDLEPPVARWIESRPDAEHLFDLDDARIYRLPQLDPAPGAAAHTPSAR